MNILGVHNGRHDAGAALFDDYRMIAAVGLERMTRFKNDGRRFPDEAVDECLTAAGLRRRDVDVVVTSFEVHPLRYIRGRDDEPAAEPVSIIREMLRQGTSDP